MREGTWSPNPCSPQPQKGNGLGKEKSFNDIKATTHLLRGVKKGSHLHDRMR